jgi:hypothetical protein
VFPVVETLPVPTPAVAPPVPEWALVVAVFPVVETLPVPTPAVAPPAAVPRPLPPAPCRPSEEFSDEQASMHDTNNIARERRMARDFMCSGLRGEVERSATQADHRRK